MSFFKTKFIHFGETRIFFRSMDFVVLYSKFCEAPLRLYVKNLYYYPIDKSGMFMEELTCV